MSVSVHGGPVEINLRGPRKFIWVTRIRLKEKEKGGWWDCGSSRTIGVDSLTVGNP